MEDKKVVSFPHLGNYYLPIKYLLTHLTNYEVKESPPITKKTIGLGSKYSPDFVCLPFKYNLGNFIESLDQGANILMQAGGGCRFGYYAALQEQILKDLGYHFKFYCLNDQDHLTVTYLYHIFKENNPHLSFFKFAHYTLLTLLMINYMDRMDRIVRQNIGFEEEIGSFENLQKKMWRDFTRKKHFTTLTLSFFHYRRKMKKLKINKPENCLKVGIIGELYTSMEPFASYFLERQLAKMGIEVRRFTDLSYLLVTKKAEKRSLLRKIKKYCQYPIGADGMDNVARVKILKKQGYDGVIHIKPFGCTPEIGAMPIIQRISNDLDLPIIFFSFDTQTSEEGIKTRLEAFRDMLEMRKEKHS